MFEVKSAFSVNHDPILFWESKKDDLTYFEHIEGLAKDFSAQTLKSFGDKSLTFFELISQFRRLVEYMFDDEVSNLSSYMPGHSVVNPLMKLFLQDIAVEYMYQDGFDTHKSKNELALVSKYYNPSSRLKSGYFSSGGLLKYLDSQANYHLLPYSIVHNMLYIDDNWGDFKSLVLKNEKKTEDFDFKKVGDESFERIIKESNNELISCTYPIGDNKEFFLMIEPPTDPLQYDPMVDFYLYSHDDYVLLSKLFDDKLMVDNRLSESTALRVAGKNSIKLSLNKKGEVVFDTFGGDFYENLLGDDYEILRAFLLDIVEKIKVSNYKIRKPKPVSPRHETSREREKTEPGSTGTVIIVPRNRIIWEEGSGQRGGVRGLWQQKKHNVPAHTMRLNRGFMISMKNFHEAKRQQVSLQYFIWENDELIKTGYLDNEMTYEMYLDFNQKLKHEFPNTQYEIQYSTYNKGVEGKGTKDFGIENAIDRTVLQVRRNTGNIFN
jgi:hypothetical protein